jgi:hypothetical protein
MSTFSHDSTLASFVGNWDIGKARPAAAPKFVMTLSADFSATKSHVPDATGTWQFIQGEGDRFRKVAFESGTRFETTANNTDPAEKNRSLR